MKCQRPGGGRGRRRAPAVWLEDRAARGGEDDARGPERQRHRAGIDHAHAHRVGGLVAASRDDRRLQPEAGQLRRLGRDVPVISGPSHVRGIQTGRLPGRRGPRPTSHARRGRRAGSPRRRPCRRRSHRSSGSVRSPSGRSTWAIRRQTSGSWSRTQTSFGAVNPVSASLPVIAMSRSGRWHAGWRRTRRWSAGHSTESPAGDVAGRVEQDRAVHLAGQADRRHVRPAGPGGGEHAAGWPPPSRPTRDVAPARSTAGAGR